MSRKTDSYFDKALTYTNGELVETMRHALHGQKYDTIVGTGLSGTIFTARVAPGLRKKFAIVRKKDDNSTHSSLKVEGMVGKRFVVADDFVCSGKTLKHILTMMHKVHPGAQFVGLYQYEYSSFKDAEKCVEDYGQWVADIALGGPLYGPKTYDELCRATYGAVVLRAPQGGWDKSVAHLVPLPSLGSLELDYLDGEEPTFWNLEGGFRIRASDKRVRLMAEQIKVSLVKDQTYGRYVGMRMDTVMRSVMRYPEANRMKEPKPAPLPVDMSAWLKSVPVQKLTEFNEAMRKADEAAIKFQELSAKQAVDRIGKAVEAG